MLSFSGDNFIFFVAVMINKIASSSAIIPAVLKNLNMETKGVAEKVKQIEDNLKKVTDYIKKNKTP